MSSKPSDRITGAEYTAFDRAYQWFNDKLFDGQLPPCLITLQRKARSRGYYANDRFGHRLNVTALTDELALNPDTFGDRTDKDILSTLVHEMCHCFEQHFGKPPRRGYGEQVKRKVGGLASTTHSGGDYGPRQQKPLLKAR